MRDDGVYLIRGRSELWMMSYNKREVILLPYGHPFSRLFVENKYRIGHQGVQITARKVRTKFSIPKLFKLVRNQSSRNAYICRTFGQ